MKKNYIIMILLMACSFQLRAQQLPQKLQKATWVRIMSNDSAYNFFQAQKEFQLFYTVFLNEKKKEANKKQKKNTAQEVHIESAADLLIADFLKWSSAIKPFVRADGSIIPVSARLAIINSSK